jgi:hypothetical protein
VPRLAILPQQSDQLAAGLVAAELGAQRGNRDRPRGQAAADPGDTLEVRHGGHEEVDA